MVGNQAFTQVKESNTSSSASNNEQTVDSFLKLWATHTPDSPALSDTTSQSEFIGRPQLDLTFGELDNIVTRLAQQFMDHGLIPGDVLAIQLPNTVELSAMVLAALRAGLIPCPFPIHWRNQELDKALQMVPAKAMVSIGELDGFSHSQMMCDLAFDHMSIRYVYGIGNKQSDGLTSLNSFFSGHPENQDAPADFTATPGLDHPAMIFWTTHQGLGLRPVYRSNREMIAAGLMHVQELGLSKSDIILNPYHTTGLIGISSILMPALLIGARVIQHANFNYDQFVNQIATEKPTYTTVPAPVLKALVDNNILQNQGKSITRIGCVWPAPLKHQKKAFLPADAPAAVYDIHNLHDTCVYISKRKDLTEQGHIKLGEKRAPGPDGQEIRLLETRFRGRLSSSNGDKQYRGTLYVRGMAVPRGAGIPVKMKGEQSTNEGWTNTGIQCSIAENASRMDRVIPEPEEDTIYHGGISFKVEELNELYKGFVGFEDVAVVTISDPVMGERLCVAAKVIEILKPTINDLTDYLRETGVSPCKFPEHIISLDRIPRDEKGYVNKREVIEMLTCKNQPIS